MWFGEEFSAAEVCKFDGQLVAAGVEALDEDVLESDIAMRYMTFMQVPKWVKKLLGHMTHLWLSHITQAKLAAFHDVLVEVPIVHELLNNVETFLVMEQLVHCYDVWMLHVFQNIHLTL